MSFRNHHSSALQSGDDFVKFVKHGRAPCLYSRIPLFTLTPRSKFHFRAVRSALVEHHFQEGRYDMILSRARDGAVAKRPYVVGTNSFQPRQGV